MYLLKPAVMTKTVRVLLMIIAGGAERYALKYFALHLFNQINNFEHKRELHMFSNVLEVI